MRIDVKKFTFIGLEQDRPSFFKEAQNSGLIHFIDHSAKNQELSPDTQQLHAALKIVRGLPVMEQMCVSETAVADGIAVKVLQLQETLNKLAEETRLAKLEIARIHMFGEFSLNDIKYIEQNSGCKAQYYVGKQHVQVPEDLFFMGSDKGLDYYAAFNEIPTQYPQLTEMRIENSLSSLKQRVNAIQNEIHVAEQKLKTYAKYHAFLHHALVEKLNTYHLQAAERSAEALLDERVFTISGWVPVNKLHELQALIAKINIHAEEVPIEASDAVPTYLENSGAHQLGEDLVHIYDTPSTTDKDPSLWVLAFFSLFFAMIVGDAGYGLVYLAAALFIRFKYTGLAGAKKRALNLATIVCVSVVGWGLLTNSFFGIALHPDNPLKKVSLIHALVETKTSFHIANQDDTYAHWVAKHPHLASVLDTKTFVRQADDLVNKFSDNVMLELALLIGSLHVIVSILRYINRNWVGLGWIAFIIGGYCYLPKYLDATSLIHYVGGLDRDLTAQFGLYLMTGGIAFAIVVSIIKNKWTGILEAMTAVQIFSDILSYLRLYALGLAGAIVASTLNDAVASLSLGLGIIIAVLGHSINMVLAIMSGTIHGLRLNFLEWYHYSFEGGGKLFKPLRKMNVD